VRAVAAKAGGHWNTSPSPQCTPSSRDLELDERHVVMSTGSAEAARDDVLSAFRAGDLER
jgi:hypothetical protein